MAPFAYHISRPIRDLVDGEFKHEIMSEFGLTHLGVKKPGTDCFVTSTKEGGTLISFDKSMSEKNIQQTWLEVREGLSIGWMPQRRPSPADLAKKMQVPGFWFSDLAKRRWQVPIINSDSSQCTIPRALSFVDGKVTKVFTEEFQSIWEFGGELFQEAVALDAYSEEWAFFRALEVLSVNYRVSGIEIQAFSEMGIFVLDAAKAVAIVLFALDYQLLEDAVKKKQVGE